MAQMTRASSPAPLQVASRLAAAFLGSYGFVSGAIAAGVSLLVHAGHSLDEARALLHLLAFPLFVACAVWAVCSSSIGRVWMTLAGGGALMLGSAWLLNRS